MRIALGLTWVKHGRAGDEHVRSPLDDGGYGVVSDAAIDLDAEVEAHSLSKVTEVSDFLDGAGEKALAAEAGVDAHDEDVVDHRENFDEEVDRGGGVDDDCGLAAVVANKLEGAVEMAAGLPMDGEEVGAGSGEVGDEPVGVLDHEVTIEGEVCEGANGFDDRGTEGDVGDEVAVHHVDVDDGAAAARGCGDFFAEAAEVRRQDGKG